MTDDSGWIKTHRRIIDWEWYSDIACFRLYMHLLITANYKPSRFRNQVIPAGSRVTGVFALAEQTGLSIQQVRTALKKLKSTGELTIKTSNKFSIISITNWEKYQKDNKQTTNKQQTNNKQTTTSKEGKKERKKEIDITVLFDEFWKAYPKRGASNPKKPAREKFEKACKNHDPQEIILGAKKYKAQERKAGKINTPYIAQATTWLNQERWKDEYDTGKRERQNYIGM